MKAEAKVEAPAGGGSKKLIIIILAVVLLLGGAGGGAAWYFLHGKADAGEEEDHAPAKKKKKKEKSGPPVFAVVEPFTVNLQPEEAGDQYLQLAMTLQLSSAEEEKNIKENMPIVRNRMLLLLSSKHASELNTPEGKQKLADEIVAKLKEPFEARGSPQEVDDVLFTSFIIQ